MKCKKCGHLLTANTLNCCPICFPNGKRLSWVKVCFNICFVVPVCFLLFSIEGLVVLLLIAFALGAMFANTGS